MEQLDIRNKNIKNILIVQIGKIGDMVLTIPLFYYMKKIFPEARLTVLASKVNAEIPRNLSYVDETIIFSQNLLTGFILLKSLRKRLYNVLIDMNYNSSRTSEKILKTLKPDISFGVNGEKKLYDHDLNIISRSPHLADMALAPAAYFDNKIIFEADAALKGEFKTETESEFKGDKKFKILFNISAGSKSRKWSNDKWVKLIEKSVEVFGTDKYSYYITGLKEESEEIDYVISKIKSKRLTAIYTKSLVHLFNIISNINLLVSPDTSLIHIASSNNIPTIGLYPNVDWNLEKFRPLAENSSVILSGNKENIFDIELSEVFEELSKIVKKIS
ncbi:glycosyltransferase family 9 protein [soil metagenome]